MQWSELYGSEHEPSDDQITGFVETPLWGDLADYLHQAYGVCPTLFYSRCSMDDGLWLGWNVKYKKSGRALCTLYPKQGYFTALIAIGTREMPEAEALIPYCDEYTQTLFHATKSGKVGKSLAMEVTSQAILSDVKNLVALRVAPRTLSGTPQPA